MKRIFRALLYWVKFCLLKIKYKNYLKIDGIGRLSLTTEIVIKNNGVIEMERCVRTSEFSKISVDGGMISIGEYTGFNRNTIISCHNSIDIGKSCLFAPNLCIYDHDHRFDDTGIQEGYRTGEIVVGNNCWIGANVVILKNTHIGEGCVIGAGCIVQGDIPAHSIVKGERKNRIVNIFDRANIKKE